MTPDPALVVGWEVVAADGFRCLKLERADAEKWAAQCHGTVHPLVIAEPAP